MCYVGPQVPVSSTDLAGEVRPVTDMQCFNVQALHGLYLNHPVFRWLLGSTLSCDNIPRKVNILTQMCVRLFLLRMDCCVVDNDGSRSNVMVT